MTVLRTLADIQAAGAALAATHPQASQATANLAHALITPQLARIRRAQAASSAA